MSARDGPDCAHFICGEKREYREKKIEIYLLIGFFLTLLVDLLSSDNSSMFEYLTMILFWPFLIFVAIIICILAYFDAG